MANKSADTPLTPEQLAITAAVRAHEPDRARRMPITPPWLRCKMEPGGKPPRAAFIQELVQAWKELRKGG